MSRFEDIHFDFLTIELDLGRTFIQTFDLEFDHNAERSATALGNAQTALKTIDKMLSPERLTFDRLKIIQDGRDSLAALVEARVALLRKNPD